MADDMDLYNSARSTVTNPFVASRSHGHGSASMPVDPSAGYRAERHRVGHHYGPGEPVHRERVPIHTPFIKQQPVAGANRGLQAVDGRTVAMQAVAEKELSDDMCDDLYGTSSLHQPALDNARAMSDSANAGHGRQFHGSPDTAVLYSHQYQQPRSQPHYGTSDRSPSGDYTHQPYVSPRGAMPAAKTAYTPPAHQYAQPSTNYKYHESADHRPPAGLQPAQQHERPQELHPDPDTTPRDKISPQHRRTPGSPKRQESAASDPNSSWSGSLSSNDLSRKQIELEGQEVDIHHQRIALDKEQKRMESRWRDLNERDQQVKIKEAEVARRSAELDQRSKSVTEQEALNASCEQQRSRIMEDNDRLKKEVARSEQAKCELDEEISDLERRKLKLLEDISVHSNRLNRIQQETRIAEEKRHGAMNDLSSGRRGAASSAPSQQPSLVAPVPVSAGAMSEALASAMPRAQSSSATANPVPVQVSSGAIKPEAAAAASRKPPARPSAASASALDYDDMPEPIRRLHASGILDGMTPQDRDTLVAETYQQYEAVRLEEDSQKLAMRLQQELQQEDLRTTASSTRSGTDLERLQDEKRAREERDMRMAQAMLRDDEEEDARVLEISRHAAAKYAAEAAEEEERGEGVVLPPTEPRTIADIHSELRGR